MEDMSKLEILEKYLLNQLSDSERLFFEKQISNDPVLREELYLLKIVNQTVIDSKAIDIKRKVKEDLDKFLVQNKRGPNKWFFYLIGIAFISVIGMVTFLLKNNDINRPKPSNVKEKIVFKEENRLVKGKDNTQNEISTKQNNDLNKENKKSIAINTPGQFLIEKDSNLNKLESANTIIENIESLNNSPIEKKSSSVPKNDLCKSFKPNPLFRINGSCEFENNGSLEILLSSGENEYFYNLNNGSKGKLNYFNQLSPGNYQVYISNSENCSASFTVEIPIKPCVKNKDLSFNPDIENLLIPELEKYPSQLIIMDKNGSEVFSRTIGSPYEAEWAGKRNDGSDLPMGVYYYSVGHSNTIFLRGTITLIR